MRLQSTGRTTEVVEVGQPRQCANGHPLGPRQVIVGYLPCLCVWPDRGHRSYTCRTCGVVTYVPVHTVAMRGSV